MLTNLVNQPRKAFLLDGGAKLDAAKAGNTVVVTLPAELPDKIDAVVALDISGATKIVKTAP